MKAVVFTLGCKVNECESNSLIRGLVERGYDVSDKLEYADLYIVNTCAVTKEAEKKSRQTVSRIKKFNENAKIIFTGCATQCSPKKFIEKCPDGLVTGTFNKGAILDMLDKSGVVIEKDQTEFEELAPVKSLRTRTFVKVQDGCNNFCSYCIIPYLRGRNRSRNPENVINEIKGINPLEAVITGINLSAYDFDGQGLKGLIKGLKDVDCRIRLGSLEVNVIDDEFLSTLKELKNFARHFHLSLQSGSDNVLKKMNRRYTAKEFLDKVNLIRKYFPDAGITTDIIVGFPTETEQDFIDTLNLVDEVKFSDIHPFIFSPREGTVAYKMPDLEYSVKKRRLDVLMEKKKECRERFIKENVGTTQEMLIEESINGYLEGYSGNYIRLYIKDQNINGIKRVKLISPFKDGVLCEII